MSYVEINESNFKQEVLNSDKPVLVDFWAPWCGPCRMLGPVIEEIAKENPDIKVCKVNTDENAQLAVMFGIDAIPCVIAFDKGSQTGKSVGFAPKEKLLGLVGK